MKVYGCPVEFALQQFGGKWRVVILARLKERPMRYGELRKAIPELSDKMLTERLRELRERGWADQVEGAYQLAAEAESVRGVLQALYDWGTVQAPGLGASFR